MFIYLLQCCKKMGKNVILILWLSVKLKNIDQMQSLIQAVCFKLRFLWNVHVYLVIYVDVFILMEDLLAEKTYWFSIFFIHLEKLWCCESQHWCGLQNEHSASRGENLLPVSHNISQTTKTVTLDVLRNT